MKKRFLIYVDIDTSRPGPSVAKAKQYGVHRILINDSLGKADALSALAHELGHVIGTELEMPARSRDPRLTLSYSVDDYLVSLIQDSEIEAWEVAYKILFRTFRDQCLATYGVQTYP